MTEEEKKEIIQLINSEKNKRPIKIKEDETYLDPDMNADRFKNRRRMAWTCLVAQLIVISYVFLRVDANFVSNYSELFWAFFGTTSSVILTYIGASSWSYNAYIKARKNNENE